ncbi:hypothetical protein ROHU_018235 [Labeo rohita]|uniref:Uncharacterized protein n=1 Tax=Labeo rohita TaxID=84645 RepID=A0A498N5I7_LABRO|nr:hypothetical protein ROHU_018235 [Labeo rohita]
MRRTALGFPLEPDGRRRASGYRTREERHRKESREYSEILHIHLNLGLRREENNLISFIPLQKMILLLFSQRRGNTCRYITDPTHTSSRH